MHWIRLIILGAVQGVTEFIPVSSSGHLVFFQRILGLQYEGITMEIAVHVGTLVAVLAVYWRDILKITAALLRTGWMVLKGRTRLWDAIREPRFYLGCSIIVASMITAGLALLFSSTIRELFGDLRVVALAWLFTGILLWSTRRLRPSGKLPSVGATIVVGLFQALATIPGISRSGSTIAAGLFSGLSREEAARYSFLLSVPAIGGAALLDIPEALPRMADTGFWQDVTVATLVAAVSGYFALRFLIRQVRRGRLYRFAWYVWPMGIFVLLWLGLGAG